LKNVSNRHHDTNKMLRLRCSSTLLRGLTAAAVPAMASCLILSGGPSLASGFGGRFALAVPASRPFVTASQVRPLMKGVWS